MTEISESGIELLPCPFCNGEAKLVSGGTGNHYVHCTRCGVNSDDGSVERAAKLWNRRHPPASREEGLREAADIAFDFAEAASSNADRLGQPSGWESAARTTARDIASAILALIPTKPEAKEGQLPGELLQAYNLAIHRRASGSSDFATVVELLRTAYPTIDRASVERFPPAAALQSKKP